MQILIISPAWIGDMVMSHSLYQTLANQYPNCQIDILAPQWSKPIVARMPEINQAFTMPLGHGEFNLTKRYQLGKSFRYQYDLAIVLPNSFKSALIPLFAKIPTRRGWKGESRYGLLNDLRTHKERYPMVVQRYVALGFDHNMVPEAENMEIPFPQLKVNPLEVAQTKKHFENLLSEESGRKAIAFSAGAEYGPAKRWPHYHFASLAQSLIKQNYAIRLFGSENDREASELIRQALPAEMQCYCLNLAGKTMLNQAVDLIADCEAMVTNDSGLMHIACAVGLKVLALYGPTDPKYTPPLSDKAKIMRLIEGKLIKVRKTANQDGYHQSLIDLQPNMVLEELSKLLAKTN